jgi:hypothetical protein
MEYVTDCLIKQVCAEIADEIGRQGGQGGQGGLGRQGGLGEIFEFQISNFTFFNNYALIKAQAKEYIRETQSRIILKSVMMNY